MQAMLDCGADTCRLTCDEFLSAAKQCMSVEGDVARQELPADVMTQLKAFSNKLASNKVRVSYVP